MSSTDLLNTVGEYALLAVIFLLIFGMISRGNSIISRRTAIVLALSLLIILLGSKNWPAIKTLYIYLFALMAVLAKFAGALGALWTSAEKLQDQYRFLRVAALVVLAAFMVVLEYADALVAPLLQANLPPTVWRAGAWIIPALGVASSVKDSARSTIQNIFPVVNPRLLLFLLVFTAGLLVPLYFPTIDQILRIAAFTGIGIGLILAFTRDGRQSTQ